MAVLFKLVSHFNFCKAQAKGQTRVTLSHNVSWLKVSFILVIKANTTGLHPKVRQTFLLHK